MHRTQTKSIRPIFWQSLPGENVEYQLYLDYNAMDRRQICFKSLQIHIFYLLNGKQIYVRFLFSTMS